jgi:hypothetical protein
MGIRDVYWALPPLNPLKGTSFRTFCPYSLTPLLPYSLTPLLPYSLTPLLPCSLTPLLPYSLAPLLPYSLTPLLPCSFYPFFHLILHPPLGYCFSATGIPDRTASNAAVKSLPDKGIPLEGLESSSLPRYTNFKSPSNT